MKKVVYTISLPLTLGKPTGWEDGSELDFSKWDAKSGPHLSKDTSQTCGVMVSSNGIWTQASCTNSRSRIVCKAPARESLFCTYLGQTLERVRHTLYKNVMFVQF